MGMQKLENVDLDQVSGGVIFNAAGISGSDPNRPWEVLDNNNGNVIDRYANREDAARRAREFGNNPMNDLEVNWSQVQQLRGRR